MKTSLDSPADIHHPASGVSGPGRAPAFRRTKPILLALLLGFIAGPPPAASGFAPDVLYVLRSSQLTDDCLICGRPPFVEPLSGTFWLRTVSENPLFAQYEVHDVAFTAGTTNSPRQYRANGAGTFVFGGEVAVMQSWYLELNINDGTGTRLGQFVSPDPFVTAVWPDVEVMLVQTNGTPAQNYSLHLIATPTTAVPLRMTAALDQTAVTLEWPTNAASCRLESSLPFRPNPIWQSVTNKPGRQGVCFFITLPVTGPGRFFRLRCD